MTKGLIVDQVGILTFTDIFDHSNQAWRRPRKRIHLVWNVAVDPGHFARKMLNVGNTFRHDPAFYAETERTNVGLCPSTSRGEIIG